MEFDSHFLNAVDENTTAQGNYITFSGPHGFYLAEPNPKPSLPTPYCVFPPHSCSLASEPIKKAVVLVQERSDKGPAYLPEVGTGGRGQRQQSWKQVLIRLGG